EIKSRRKFSSFQSQQIVSQPQSNSRRDKSDRKGAQHSASRDRVIFKIKAAVHPITGLDPVRPVTAAREEPMVGSITEEERGERPLHRERNREKSSRQQNCENPIPPPRRTTFRCARDSRASEQPINQVNGDGWCDE